MFFGTWLINNTHKKEILVPNNLKCDGDKDGYYSSIDEYALYITTQYGVKILAYIKDKVSNSFTAIKNN
jgi:hypothetical protein